MLEHQNSEIGSDADGGSGHGLRGTQSTYATSAPIPEIVDREVGVGEIGHTSRDTQTSRVDLAALIDTLREEWRRRQSWARAEKSLLLQAKAACRRLIPSGSLVEADALYRATQGVGDHPRAGHALVDVFPLVEARKVVESHRKRSERTLLALARQLPVAPFVEATRGVGLLSLAGIVGEAGDLSNYGTPSRLWKRMGTAVIDGQRQRMVGGAEALVHGYSPVRRSLLWNVGCCIIKAGGPLKDLYDARKVKELVKCEAIAADPVQRALYTRGGRYAPKLHAHNRARRYVEKRVLVLLWREWTGQELKPIA